MKRILSLVALAALIVGLPASHWVLSAPPVDKPEKVMVCHIQGQEQGPDGPVDRETGVLIEVSQVAAEHHLAQHRDCVEPVIVVNKDGSCSCDCQKQCELRVKQCILSCDPRDQKCLDACKREFIVCQEKCSRTK